MPVTSPILKDRADRLRAAAALLLSCVMAMCAPGIAEASVDLVQDGDFSGVYATSPPWQAGTASAQFGETNYATGYTPAVLINNWTTTGYNFVYLPGTADTTGATGQFGTMLLWGPGDGAANGFEGPPGGGNFIAADATFETGPIITALTGLTPGMAVAVSFDWGGLQQYGYSGATQNSWTVSLTDTAGNSTSARTPAIAVPSHGFIGWLRSTLMLVPTSASETLSFLASGAPPSGAPPFTLLANVSAITVPEPGSLPVLASGLILLAGCFLRRRLGARRGD